MYGMSGKGIELYVGEKLNGNVVQKLLDRKREFRLTINN
jgi:hypothetical protein